MADIATEPKASTANALIRLLYVARVSMGCTIEHIPQMQP